MVLVKVHGDEAQELRFYGVVGQDHPGQYFEQRIRGQHEEVVGDRSKQSTLDVTLGVQGVCATAL